MTPENAIYLLVGADGRQYGPVTVTQLRQWIREKRADGRSRVRTVEDPLWKPLRSWPELAAELGEVSAEPPPICRRVRTGEALGSAMLSQGLRFDFYEVLQQGWKLFAHRLWLHVGLTAIVLLLVLGLNSLPILGNAACFLLLYAFQAGLVMVFVRRLRRQPVEVGTLFAGFGPALGALVAGAVVSWLLTLLGFVLCLVPGIYLLVSWQLFAPLLILDRNLDFWEALECSRRVVGRCWWRVFLLTLLAAALVTVVGLLTFFVGVFLVLPLAAAWVAVAYEQLFPASVIAAPRGSGAPPETLAPETAAPVAGVAPETAATPIDGLTQQTIVAVPGDPLPGATSTPDSTNPGSLNGAAPAAGDA